MSRAGKRHVVLVGAGAVGVTLAGFLLQQDHRVTLIVRSGTRDPLPLRILDEINDRALTLDGLEMCHVAELPPTADHVVICTRGEQLEEALRSLRGKLQPDVPVTIAAATFDSLHALARKNGLSNPVLRMGVGFAAWPVSQQRHRVYGYMPRGSAIACEGLPHHTAARNDLARILSASGLPT
ncbi:MAG: Ketopantoate reductase PanE/ApbA, partial [Myxococcaceae bacterium]|nr:Ketopantoate reductase PanE/ApbA [Myxococcaceae bacterium]